MSLAIRGNDFLKFVGVNEAILELVDRKSTLFAKLTSVFWPFWGSKKSFSGLFQSCFGSVWALFLTLKGLLLGVFSA